MSQTTGHLPRVQIREITARPLGIVLLMKGDDNRCLALGNNQQSNIIIHEYLFTGDVQMSGFFAVVVMVVLFLSPT